MKVLDFGLAKRMPGSGVFQAEDAVSNLSIPGQILGTFAYMSPEQVQGQEVDQRSDLFAFGTMLYEMLTGQNPWPCTAPVATLYAILHNEPRPIEAASPLAAGLAAIVGKLLCKNPADRYASAQAVLDALALEPAGGAAVAVAKENALTSIAVLPFANLSADKENEYFSDGLAEEILNLLAKISGLKVIARSSSFAFRGKEQDISKIAGALLVQNVLEGSVRRSGNRIRVTAQLIRASDASHLWSERYDRDMTDIFAIQDEIGQAISEALAVRLAPRTRVVNVEAWEHWLKGVPLSGAEHPGQRLKSEGTL